MFKRTISHNDYTVSLQNHHRSILKSDSKFQLCDTSDMSKALLKPNHEQTSFDL